ncbi:MAG: hypothetical protein AB7V50_09870, partial [Vampirovibrionia bacterium]
MVSSWLLTIFAVLVIFALGFMSLAAIKDLIARFSLLMVAGLSWLMGCFIIVVSSYVVFFLHINYIELNS